MAKFICQHCGQQPEEPDASAGLKMPCPACGETMLRAPSVTMPAKTGKLSLPPVTRPEGFSAKQVSDIAQQLIANVENVIVGKHEQVTLAVAVLLAEGHLLIEDVPGVAKTMLARAVAQSAGCSVKRIQCTPEFLPTDVLGEPLYSQNTGRQ